MAFCFIAFHLWKKVLAHSQRIFGEGHHLLVHLHLWREIPSELRMTCNVLVFSDSLLSVYQKLILSLSLDRYEAGLLFAYLAFVPFCEAGIMDGLSLQVSNNYISITF